MINELTSEQKMLLMEGFERLNSYHQKYAPSDLTRIILKYLDSRFLFHTVKLLKELPGMQP